MTINDYQVQAKEFATYPENAKFAYLVMGLCGESGEVAEKFKKIIRDKNSEIDEKDREEIAKELGDVIWYVSELSRSLDLSLEEVVEMNINKLQSRKKRNKLKGSGDNR